MSPKLHISHNSSLWDSVCPLGRSIAFTNPILYWFLFLCLLRCFNPAGSSSLLWVSPKRLDVQFGNLRIKGSLRLHGVISRLGTTFISARAEQFTKWRSNWLNIRPGYVCTPSHCDGNDHRQSLQHLLLLLCLRFYYPFSWQKQIAYFCEWLFGRWKWTGWDLNPWPPACKAGDLPLIYRPLNKENHRWTSMRWTGT